MSTNHIFQEGSIIGDYELEKFIGSGGSAEVWQVRDQEDNLWAMKIFSPDKGMDAAGIGFFKKEFTKTLDLEHPNILSGLKYGEFNRRPYILFDLCTTSLMSRLKRRLMDDTVVRKSKYTEREIAVILANVADALDYLHEKGVIHQDIKPDNILVLDNLNGKERYLISDFGVSTKMKKTIMQETQMLVKEKSGLSPDYAAPEQFKGSPIKKSDIFSLGVTLYELCEGETPSRSNITCTAEALMNGGTIPDISEDFSARLNVLIKSCLALDPERRPTASLINTWAKTYLENGFWPADTGKVAQPSKTSLSKVLKVLAALVTLVVIGFFGYRAAQADKGSTAKFDTFLHSLDYDEAIDIAEANKSEAFYQSVLPELQKLQSLIKSHQKMGNNYAIFINSDGKAGIIKDGFTIKVEAEYDRIAPFESEEIIMVFKDGKCGYIDADGNELFEGIVYDDCDRYSTIKEAKKALHKG